MADEGAPRSALRWPLVRLLLALAVAVALAGWPAPPERLHAQGPQELDLVPFAQAYTAAWNAHDLDAVLAFFAPGAVVRERRGDVPPAVWDTRDPQAARAYLNSVRDLEGNNNDPGSLVWVDGRQEIAAWAAAHFAQDRRVAADQYRADGSAVGWQSSAPYRQMPGVGPLEGTAEAVLRGGRITSLTLVLSPASVARRASEVSASAQQTRATQRPSPFGGGSSGQSRGLLRDGPIDAEPTNMAWPLALGGLAVLAYVTASLRWRHMPQT